MTGRPTVWRVVWKRAGLTMRSDWSIHYDVVREFLDEKREQMPGTDARMEAATVQSVEDVRIMDFSALDEDAEPAKDVAVDAGQAVGSVSRAIQEVADRMCRDSRRMNLGQRQSDGDGDD